MYMMHSPRDVLPGSLSWTHETGCTDVLAFESTRTHKGAPRVRGMHNSQGIQNSCACITDDSVREVDVSRDGRHMRPTYEQPAYASLIHPA